MFVRVRFRAYPTPEQVAVLARNVDNCRFVRNLALEQRLLAARLGYKAPMFVEQSKDLSELRNDPVLAPWLKATPVQVLQQALRDLDDAYRRWWSGQNRRPRFKRRETAGSFRLPQRAALKRISKRWGTVPLPGSASRLRVRTHRALPGRSKSFTYAREPDGTWWVSVCCEVRDRNPTVHRRDSGPIGVDLGVAVPVALSTGELHTFVSLTRGEQKRLVRLQRQLSRQRAGSANSERTKLQIASLRARQRRRRRNFAHEMSHRLTSSHALVAFEDLKVANMTRTAKGSVDKPGERVKAKSALNRVILDVGWSEIRTLTELKAARTGTTVLVVRPAYTSQTCPECGSVDRNARVTRSKYVCSNAACGYAGHADVSAARNILLRASDRARVGGLVPGAAEGTPVAARSVQQDGDTTEVAAEPSAQAGLGSGNDETGHRAARIVA